MAEFEGDGLFPERIETDRLVLERLDEAIEPIELYEICSADDGIEDLTRYMPWTPHETPTETREFLDRSRTKWENDECASYAIFPRDGEDGSDEFAGVGSLATDWDRRTGNLGTWLRKRYWGRGYSGERAAALMELAFERLDLELISVTHHVENEKSRRAIETYVERHGGRREGVLRNFVPYEDHVADEVRYTISREEYETASA